MSCFENIVCTFRVFKSDQVGPFYGSVSSVPERFNSSTTMHGGIHPRRRENQASPNVGWPLACLHAVTPLSFIITHVTESERWPSDPTRKTSCPRRGLKLKLLLRIDRHKKRHDPPMVSPPSHPAARPIATHSTFRAAIHGDRLNPIDTSRAGLA